MDVQLRGSHRVKINILFITLFLIKIEKKVLLDQIETWYF